MSDEKLIKLGSSSERFGNQSVGDLPKEIPPPRDLWPGIRARIESRETTRSSSGDVGGYQWWQLAAAAVTLVVASSLTTLWVTEVAPERPSAAMTDEGARPHLEQIRFGSLNVASPTYRQARADVASELLAQMHRLSPETRDKVLANLAEIQRALDEINVALEQDPNNILLQQLLLTTYQNELALITNVSRMIETAPARTEI